MLLNPFQKAVRVREGFPFMPGALPFLGHLPAMFTEPLKLMRHGVSTLGPLFWVDVGSKINLVCADNESFGLLKNRVTTSRHYRDKIEPFVGNSLLVQDGADHQHVRSAMNGPFTPRGLGEADTAAVLADLIEAHVRPLARRRELHILAETRELALSLIFRMIGLDVAELPLWREKYEDLVLTAVPLPIEFPGSPRWRGKRGRAWLSAGLARMIETARQGGGASGVLAQLVAAKDAEGQPLTSEELMDNLLLLTLAGHETTASIMAWMVLHLAEDERLWQRLVEEASRNEVPRHPQQLKRFPFAEALFRECLRMYPPGPLIPRQVTAPLSLLDRPIPVGTIVIVPVIYLLRDPERYPKPDRFLPERWLTRKEPLSPLETMAFGGGPHFCLGYHVAWLEAVQFAVILAQTLHPAHRRPHLETPLPRPLYLPLGHPPMRTRVRLVRC